MILLLKNFTWTIVAFNDISRELLYFEPLSLYGYFFCAIASWTIVSCNDSSFEPFSRGPLSLVIILLLDDCLMNHCL